MSVIAQALAQRITHLGYHVSATLAARHPELELIEGHAHAFDVRAYADAGQCSLEIDASAHAQILTEWSGAGLARGVENVMYNVLWNGERLNVLFMTFAPETPTYYWLLARTRQVAEAFFSEVCRWCTEVHSEILVFAGGQFYKDETLYQEIKSASLDKIVLREHMKDDIVADLRGFFDSKSLYEGHGVPWKRGVLFIGPPGNGKTMMVKAVVSGLHYPCIYVKSFDLPMNAYPQAGINAVFARARHSTPCILVLEDLDALVGDHNRSFFLNELDGFASNAGIITIATSNHPERLDPSILERPSRFDRKYHFGLPSAAERLAFLQLWNKTLSEKLSMSEQSLEQVAEETDGFSFAYIKELYLSSMMRYMSDNQSQGFANVLFSQIEALRAQMSSVPDASMPSLPDSPPNVAQMMAMRWGRFGADPRYSSIVVTESAED